MIVLYILGIAIAFLMGMITISLFSLTKADDKEKEYELDRLESALKQSRASAKYWADEHFAALRRITEKINALNNIQKAVMICDLITISRICHEELAAAYDANDGTMSAPQTTQIQG